MTLPFNAIVPLALVFKLAALTVLLNLVVPVLLTKSAPNGVVLEPMELLKAILPEPLLIVRLLPPAVLPLTVFENVTVPLVPLVLRVLIVKLELLSVTGKPKVKFWAFPLLLETSILELARVILPLVKAIAPALPVTFDAVLRLPTVEPVGELKLILPPFPLALVSIVPDEVSIAPFVEVKVIAFPAAVILPVVMFRLARKVTVPAFVKLNPEVLIAPAKTLNVEGDLKVTGLLNTILLPREIKPLLSVRPINTWVKPV